LAEPGTPRELSYFGFLMNDTQKMEIADIASRLGRLARSGALRDDFNVACLQGADLLKKVRRIVLGNQEPDDRIAN
jgi:hypothetical protein